MLSGQRIRFMAGFASRWCLHGADAALVSLHGLGDATRVVVVRCVCVCGCGGGGEGAGNLIVYSYNREAPDRSSRQAA